MKRIFVLLTLAAVLFLSASCRKSGGKNPAEPVVLSPVTVGSAYGNLSKNAVLPWDLKVYGGCLYVGGGDYDVNTSPEVFRRYRIETGVWEECGTVPDEQINRFLVIGETLVVPGTDPTEGWELGNFYLLKNGTFRTVRTIPGGIHNFDMTEFDGKLFAGIGVSAGSFPAVVSTDGGNSFRPVDFVRDGELLDTSENKVIRVYDFMTLNGSLYAFTSLDGSLDIYAFDGERFVYRNSWLHRLIRIVSTYSYINAKEVVGEKLYFTTGKLYVTENMTALTAVEFSKDTLVTDLSLSGGRLFALCVQHGENGGYVNCVYEINGTAPTLLASFAYDAPALSFDYADGCFWFGFGILNKISTMTGTVAKAPYPAG